MQTPTMKHRLALALLGSTLVLSSCGASGGGKPEGTIGNSGNNLDVFQASNGFGLMLPHQVFAVDASGLPTNQLVSIDSLEDLIANVNPNNPILPPPQWPTAAILPSGNPGNHFIYVQFTQPLNVNSVLTASPSGLVNSGLTGTITVVGIDPVTGSVQQIQGRAFIGGATYAGTPTGSPPLLPLQQWVALDGNNVPEALDVDNGDPETTFFPGLGFPGTEDGSPFQGSEVLASPNTFVFVPDTDGDLTDHETFPANLQIRVKVTTGVTSSSTNKSLLRQAVASSTVGPDNIPPEVFLSPPPTSTPTITPGNGDVGVDPLTDIVVEFTEPVQIATVGSLPDGTPPSLSSSVVVSFGPAAQTVQVPFHVVPESVLDLTRIRLVPFFNFPGAGADQFQCGVFNTVSVAVSAAQFADLNGRANVLGPTTNFSTGAGPGLVNAPVAPDTIYAGRVGALGGISVVDLNGFGQGTGNPTFDPLQVLEEGSKFPYNPNVALQGTSLIPPLSIGSCTFDAGSRGAFTLALDSNLSDLLVRPPLIESVIDMTLGQPLDSSFNNGPPPFGCQSGGGNLCAVTGLKAVTAVAGGPNTQAPAQAGQFGTGSVGAPNFICWAPHPNPPPLIFPPLCVSPFIGGQEPTSINSSPFASGNPGTIILNNLLVPSPANPMGGVPAGGGQLGPPQGLVAAEQNSYFIGPSPPQGSITACATYGIRQQIGHFLYVSDRVRNEVVVLNSNRMSVIDRIAVPDPTEFAVSPNVDLLAVSNQSPGVVSFIDINPASPSLHQVVKTTVVGAGPTGIAWQPQNEDIFVCNEGDSTVSIISALSLEVRKTLGNQLANPFDVAIMPRQNQGVGLSRGVYFAYILNRDGRISFYESGPDGVNGLGFDDIIGQPEFVFETPKAIQPDHLQFGTPGLPAQPVWIVHENQLDSEGKQTNKPGGALSRLVIAAGTNGPVPLDTGLFGNPQIRDLEFAVAVSIGPEQLSGVPVDIAFDNLNNFGGAPAIKTGFSAGEPAAFNSKDLLRLGKSNGTNNTNQAAFIFLAVPNGQQQGGVIDVIEISNSIRFDVNVHQPGIQSIPCEGVNVLMDYFRQ